MAAVNEADLTSLIHNKQHFTAGKIFLNTERGFFECNSSTIFARVYAHISGRAIGAAWVLGKMKHEFTEKIMEVQIHMARIAGVDLPREKRVEIGLTYIYGIGRVSANKILEQANVNPDTRCRDLTDDEVKAISAVIDETMTVEGDLRREIALNIKRLQEIGCYRGIRHRKGLPVRGQKTKTNARTRKGPKRTVANKKK